MMPIRGLWNRASERGIVTVVQNAAALYSSQFASYLLPLATVPYLTRTLGPETWGRVAFGQATGLYVLLVVEYGFNFSATREVAQGNTRDGSLRELVAGVMGARFVLAAACLAIALGAVRLSPMFEHYGAFFWLGVLWGALLAIRPVWYFLGTQRMVLVTAVDLIAKLAATLVVFALVRGPGDALLVLVAQSLAACISAVTASVLLYREVALMLPSISTVRSALRIGSGFFMLSASYSLYGYSSLFIVGLFAPGVAVGFYAAAEKIQRGIVNLSGPATQALYPQSSSLVVTDLLKASRVARGSTVAIFLASVMAAAVLFVGAPVIVPIVFGPGYSESIPLLKALSLVLIPVGMSIPLTSQWLFPLGLEPVVTRIAFVTGVFHVGLAVTLVHYTSAIGAAYSLLVTEIVIVSAIWLVLVRRGLNPFAGAERWPSRLSPIGESIHHAPPG